MPTPFPGMDPYLEHPGLWPDVHNRLLAALADELGDQLRPAYYARLEERTYVVEPEGLLLVGRPDVSVLGPQALARQAQGKTAGAIAVEVPVPDRVRETYLEVRAAGSGEVVTAIELLSPTNKRAGEGRRLYEHKRQLVLGTLTNLVEIDLIRAGDPMAIRGSLPASQYRILVSRSTTRPRAELLPFSLRDPIPHFALPLRGEPTEPTIALGPLLHRLYERAAYDMSVDYRQDPVPGLEPEDQAWADELLRQAELR